MTVERPTRTRLRHLRRELEEHSYRYFARNDPLISDAEYDRLMREAQAIEAEHPEWISSDSPTQRIGAQPVEGFATVEHHVPMLSLDNATAPEDIKAFDARIRRLLETEEPVTYTVELKASDSELEASDSITVTVSE